MSYHEYEQGLQIAALDFPFYALIQAAMRQADTDNLDSLRRAFPRVYDDYRARYNAPGGRLPEDDQ